MDWSFSHGAPSAGARDAAGISKEHPDSPNHFLIGSEKTSVKTNPVNSLGLSLNPIHNKNPLCSRVFVIGYLKFDIEYFLPPHIQHSTFYSFDIGYLIFPFPLIPTTIPLSGVVHYLYMFGTTSLDFFGTMSSEIPTTLSPVVLWVIFVIVCIAWSILASILVYHWNAYDAQSKRLKRIRRTFFIGSALILSLAVSFIFSL